MDAIRSQYEAYPYPHRDPEDERERDAVQRMRDMVDRIRKKQAERG